MSVTILIIAILMSGPCAIAYLLGKKAGYNEAIGKVTEMNNQRGGIDWNFRNPADNGK